MDQPTDRQKILSTNTMWRKKYEETFGKQVGAVGARAFGLGRHGLVILLKALGVSEYDKVGVCGYTCLCVSEAVKICGAIPVYLDVDEHLCISPQEILRQEAASLKVVILQHTFGIPGQLDKLLAACETIGAKVVEDCAHSLGCFWKGEPLGKFGEGAIYSFQWGKPYSTGQGGMLTVNSQSILEKIDREIEKWAMLMPLKSDLLLDGLRRLQWVSSNLGLESWLRYLYFKLRDAGLVKSGSFNLNSDFRLFRGYIRFAGEMTARTGLRQLDNWPRLKQLRRQKTQMIEEHLSKAGLNLWPKPIEADVTMLRYPVMTPRRSKIIEEARNRRLDISGWYISPVHPLQGDGLAKVNYQSGSCPKAENTLEQLVFLPTGPTLTLESLKAMVSIIFND